MAKALPQDNDDRIEAAISLVQGCLSQNRAAQDSVFSLTELKFKTFEDALECGRRVLKELALHDGNHVLHVGSNNGLFTTLFACCAGINGTVHGIETSAAMVNEARKVLKGLADVQNRFFPIKYVCGDVFSIDHVRNVQYDRIYVSVRCPPANLSWLLRLLKPGGILVTLVKPGDLAEIDKLNEADSKRTRVKGIEMPNLKYSAKRFQDSQNPRKLVIESRQEHVVHWWESVSAELAAKVRNSRRSLAVKEDAFATVRPNRTPAADNIDGFLIYGSAHHLPDPHGPDSQQSDHVNDPLLVLSFNLTSCLEQAEQLRSQLRRRGIRAWACHIDSQCSVHTPPRECVWISIRKAFSLCFLVTPQYLSSIECEFQWDLARALMRKGFYARVVIVEFDGARLSDSEGPKILRISARSDSAGWIDEVVLAFSSCFPVAAEHMTEITTAVLQQLAVKPGVTAESRRDRALQCYDIRHSYSHDWQRLVQPRRVETWSAYLSRKRRTTLSLIRAARQRLAAPTPSQPQPELEEMQRHVSSQEGWDVLSLPVHEYFPQQQFTGPLESLRPLQQAVLSTRAMLQDKPIPAPMYTALSISFDSAESVLAGLNGFYPNALQIVFGPEITDCSVALMARTLRLCFPHVFRFVYTAGKPPPMAVDTLKALLHAYVERFGRPTSFRLTASGKTEGCKIGFHEFCGVPELRISGRPLGHTEGIKQTQFALALLFGDNLSEVTTLGEELTGFTAGFLMHHVAESVRTVGRRRRTSLACEWGPFGNHLHFAAAGGGKSMEALVKLCHALDVFEPKQLNARDAQGNTPLAIAIFCGNEFGVTELIRQGAEVGVAELYAAARLGSGVEACEEQRTEEDIFLQLYREGIHQMQSILEELPGAAASKEDFSDALDRLRAAIAVILRNVTPYDKDCTFLLPETNLDTYSDRVVALRGIIQRFAFLRNAVQEHAADMSTLQMLCHQFFLDLQLQNLAAVEIPALSNPEHEGMRNDFNKYVSTTWWRKQPFCILLSAVPSERFLNFVFSPSEPIEWDDEFGVSWFWQYSDGAPVNLAPLVAAKLGIPPTAFWYRLAIARRSDNEKLYFIYFNNVGSLVGALEITAGGNTLHFGEWRALTPEQEVAFEGKLLQGGGRFMQLFCWEVSKISWVHNPALGTEGEAPIHGGFLVQFATEDIPSAVSGSPSRMAFLPLLASGEAGTQRPWQNETLRSLPFPAPNKERVIHHWKCLRPEAEKLHSMAPEAPGSDTDVSSTLPAGPGFLPGQLRVRAFLHHQCHTEPAKRIQQAVLDDYRMPHCRVNLAPWHQPVMYMLFVVFLLIFLGNDPLTRRPVHPVMLPTLVSPLTQAQMPPYGGTLEGISSLDDIWCFLKGPFIEALFPENAQPFGGMAELVGLVLLQQYSTMPCQCPELSPLFLKDHMASTSTAGFWSTFRDPSSVVGFPSDSTTNNTLQVLLGLEKGQWLTKHTRALVCRFSLYLPDVDLYLYARLLFEVSPAGGVLPQPRFNLVALRVFDTGGAIVVTLFQLILVVFFVYMVFREARDLAIAFALYGDKGNFVAIKHYLTSEWNAVNLLVCLWCIVAFGFAVAAHVEATIQGEITQKPRANQFYDLSSIGTLVENMRLHFGMLTLLSLLSSSTYLRHLPIAGLHLHIFFTTLCSRTVGLAVLVFLLVLLCFAAFIVIAQPFLLTPSLYFAVFRVFHMGLGDFEEKIPAINTSDETAPLLGLVAAVVVSILILNMLIAVVSAEYEKQRKTIIKNLQQRTMRHALQAQEGLGYPWWKPGDSVRCQRERQLFKAYFHTPVAPGYTAETPI